MATHLSRDRKDIFKHDLVDFLIRLSSSFTRFLSRVSPARHGYLPETVGSVWRYLTMSTLGFPGLPHIAVAMGTM